MLSVTVETVFKWTDRLTRQASSNALTQEMLVVCQELTLIADIYAYEIYKREKIKLAEDHYSHQWVGQRLPIDFSQENREDEYSDILEKIIETELLQAIQFDSHNFYILNIKVPIGPRRAILIKGLLQDEVIANLKSILAIYTNLMVLHDQKERDLLTSLPNRQSFDSCLMEVCEYFQTDNYIENKQSWIAMLDIDHFKRVNDDFGHLYGDEVLLHFSQIIEKSFRYNDFYFRFGGEEFVVIVNLVDIKSAKAIFERFRSKVENFNFPTVGRVTVSIGVTEIEHHALPMNLLDHADQALYHGKDTGRNKVVFFQDMDVKDDIESDDIELF